MKDQPDRYIQYKICRVLGEKYQPGNIIQAQEIKYIYHYIVARWQIEDHRIILDILVGLDNQFGVPGRHRLDRLYQQIKLAQMEESHRYGTAVRLPLDLPAYY